jgi:hypothetical protein
LEGQNLSGQIADWSINDLLQIMQVTKKTGSLDIEGERRGRIHFVDGAVTGAELSGDKGIYRGTDRGSIADILYVLSTLETGTFGVGAADGPDGDGLAVEDVMGEVAASAPWRARSSMQACSRRRGSDSSKRLMMASRWSRRTGRRSWPWYSPSPSTISSPALGAVEQCASSIRCIVSVWPKPSRETTSRSGSINWLEASPRHRPNRPGWNRSRKP